jgi:hypothetical protein
MFKRTFGELEAHFTKAGKSKKPQSISNQNHSLPLTINLAEGLKPNVSEGAKHKVKAAEKEA